MELMLEYKLKGCHALLYSFEGSPKHKDYGILPLGFHQLLTLWPGSTRREYSASL